MSRIFALLAAYAGLASACYSGVTPARAPTFSDPRIEPTVIGRGPYIRVIWLNDGSFLVGKVRGSDGDRLAVLSDDGREESRVPLGSAAGCHLSNYWAHTTLPDGRVGILRDCHPPKGGTVNHLMAYDVESGKLDILVRDAIPLPVTQFTWSPTEPRGIAGGSDQLCATLLWLEPTGPKFARLTFTHGGATHRIDRSLYDPERGTCSHKPIADWPAWSSRDQIAFFFSAAAADAAGFDRLRAPSALYVMDAHDLRPRKVLSGIASGRALAWSPDGKWLAFGALVPRVTDGTWLFNVETSTLVRILDFRASFLAWSPSGDRVAVIVDASRGDFPSGTGLLIFDVSNVV